MDQIHIIDLLVRCILGMQEDERREKQEVLISVSLETDLTRSGLTDRLDDTVDYRLLKKQILRMAEASNFYLAERLAQAVADICLSQPLVRSAKVSVTKPNALRFARSVAVEISRTPPARMRQAFVGLGSNLQPVENVRKALSLLSQKTKLRGLSMVYLTPAEARPGDPDFFNTVAEIYSPYPPLVLKHFILRRIEEALGRQRDGNRFGPRTIDLDLVYFEDQNLDAPDLALPDPHILRRPYLAIGLQELAPDLRLPGWNLTIDEVAACMPKSRMKPLSEYTENLRKDLIHGRKREAGAARAGIAEGVGGRSGT
jgi:dihydroneopterin aldolase/2-amino-4-hydroxy-6-hydroxymethyldihydropteridine diphosphokinase